MFPIKRRYPESGKDIAFSHYDYLDKNELSILPKITITPPTDKIGEQAAEQLLKRIKKKREGNEKGDCDGKYHTWNQLKRTKKKKEVLLMKKKNINFQQIFW